jgi:hypothetical protein
MHNRRCWLFNVYYAELLVYNKNNKTENLETGMVFIRTFYTKLAFGGQNDIDLLVFTYATI